MKTGRDMHIDHMQLMQGAKGGQTKAEANAARSWLLNDETEVILKYIIECGNCGFHLSHCRPWEHVNEILKAKMTLEKFAGLSAVGGIGKKWTDQFVEKHSDRIKMSWAACLEAKRGHTVNKHTVQAWFNLVEMIQTQNIILLAKTCMQWTKLVQMH